MGDLLLATCYLGVVGGGIDPTCIRRLRIPVMFLKRLIKDSKTIPSEALLQTGNQYALKWGGQPGLLDVLQIIEIIEVEDLKPTKEIRAELNLQIAKVRKKKKKSGSWNSRKAKVKKRRKKT